MKNRIFSLLLFLLAAVNIHAAEGITIRLTSRIQCSPMWYSFTT